MHVKSQKKIAATQRSYAFFAAMRVLTFEF